MVKGIKRHVLTCSLGFVLAVVVTAANVHDTAAAGPLLDKAVEQGWSPKRVNVDGIYTGERMEAAAERHDLAVQVSSKPADVAGFTPLPLRWRIEANLRGTDQLLSPADPKSGAGRNSVRRCGRNRQLSPRPESLCPTD